MKRIIAFALAFLIVSGTATITNISSEKYNVSAADISEDFNVNISITKSEETVLYGDLLYFDICFSECKNIYDGNFEISYDKELSFEKYEMLQGMGTVHNNDGKLSIEISKKDGFSDGGIIRVYFRAPIKPTDDASNMYCSVEIKDPNFGSSGSCQYSSSGIYVADYIYIENEGAYYYVSNDYAVLGGLVPEYNGKVMIPDKIHGVPVTALHEIIMSSATVTDIIVSENSEYFSSRDGVLFNKDGTELLLYPYGKKDSSYTVPNGCKVIKSRAFFEDFYNGDSELETIEIPDSVVLIEDSAIHSFDKILTIKGYSDTEAQRYASEKYIRFYDLGSGNSYDASISGTCGNDLTWHLSQEGVMTISGNGMMEQFVQQKNCAETPWWNYSNFIKTLIVEEGVMSISNDAFAWCHSLEYVDLPNSLRILDYQAFYACDGLTNVDLPEGLVEIGVDCFAGCFLQSVKLPESLMYIRDCAFTDFNIYDGRIMKGFTTIYIPKNVREVNNAFWGCSSLAIVQVDPENKNLYTYDGALYEKNKLIFVPDTKKSLHIKEGAWIDDSFYGIDSIENLYISNNTSINSDLFNYNFYFENLESINVVGNNSDYSSQNGVLYNKDKTCLLYCPRNYKSTVIELPESVTRINCNFHYDNIVTDIYYSGSECDLELPEYFTDKITIHYNTTFSSSRGDANNDGIVSVADAVMLQKWLLGSGSLYNWQNVDLCKDGKIDVFDMVLLRKLIIKKDV